MLPRTPCSTCFILPVPHIQYSRLWPLRGSDSARITTFSYLCHSALPRLPNFASLLHHPSHLPPSRSIRESTLCTSWKSIQLEPSCLGRELTYPYNLSVRIVVPFCISLDAVHQLSRPQSRSHSRFFFLSYRLHLILSNTNRRIRCQPQFLSRTLSLSTIVSGYPTVQDWTSFGDSLPRKWR